MTKELRRLSILVLAMFLALFASVTVIQGVQADTLAENPHNTRTRLDSYEVQRGAIVVSGSAIASSTPVADKYAFQRVYADPDLWAPVTGYYNPVLGSATGIEQSLNRELSGASASQFFARFEEIISGQPARGSSVQLTLDAKVQRAAREAMGDYEGAVVAIEPSTGRILAMVSTPGYDTNTLAAHDGDAVDAAYKQLLDDPSDPLFNRAIGGDMNPPGSTFKLVVAAAALESGDYTATSALPNPATFTLPQSSSVVTNASGTTCGPGKTVTIADALRLSCNIPMAELALKLGDDRIRETAEKFGFNQSFNVPMEAAASEYPDKMDDANLALSGFGQSNVRATPLQIAMVSAAIANKGVVMNPNTVDSILGSDLSVQRQDEPSQFGQAVSPEVAGELVKMMVANVSEGVASGATIEGVDVAGKTGTAENGDDQPYSLWFTGFAPAEDPKVAVAVVVENGGGQGQEGSGDAIAAPVAKKVMEAVLNR